MIDPSSEALGTSPSSSRLEPVEDLNRRIRRYLAEIDIFYLSNDYKCKDFIKSVNTLDISIYFYFFIIIFVIC